MGSPDIRYTADMGMLSRVLDVVLPPRCAGCDAITLVPNTLCSSCFAGLVTIGDPACRLCGHPFEIAGVAGPSLTCPACTADPPPWSRGRAALLYDGASRPLVLALKHADRQENAELLAAHMARAGRALLDEAELLVPVPLHRLRLWQRGFNQAALLAAGLARRAPHARTLPDALRRTRRTPMLGGLSAAARRTVLGGAIAVRPGRHSRIAGARVLLIDDVLTTGATARACARALLDAGAGRVELLVCCRVPDPCSL